MSTILTLRFEDQRERVDLARCDNARLRQLAGHLYSDVAVIEERLKRGGSLDWEERARAALGIRRGQLAAIEKEQARRQERAERATTQRQFFELARAQLPPATFERLLASAEDAARKVRLATSEAG